MPHPCIIVTISVVLVPDSSFGHNYVNRANIWMEDSGKHHQLGQSTKSVLDPTGHLYNNKWGKEIYSDSHSSVTYSPQTISTQRIHIHIIH